MATFSESDVMLPSYLKKWPALHTIYHIDLYCEYSQKAEVAMENLMHLETTKYQRTQFRKSMSQAFHKQLKAAIL